MKRILQIDSQMCPVHEIAFHLYMLKDLFWHFILCNPYVICVFQVSSLYNIFLQKYLRKVAELVYIARLHYIYPDAYHCIPRCTMAKVFHMPKTEFNYRVLKKKKHTLAYNA